MKRRIKKLIHQRNKKNPPVETPAPVAEGVPRITNETVAEHREERLTSARKYIYPLQHSKHKIVLFTSAIIITALVAFMTYSAVALYKLQSTSAFMYGVTRVIPFPIARTGKKFIAYENYLFELRHYIHYYETQQKLDFNTDFGKAQLAEFKKRALNRVIDDVYIKQLAQENGVSVSDNEVNDQISVLRTQNRLGSNDKVFEDVLKDYWGWSVDDFKRSLKQQLLAQKVIAVLDKDTNQRAQAALAELKAGADFGAVATKYSEDQATKASGGQYAFLVDKTNKDLNAKTTETLYKLQPGQISDVVSVDYTLEIYKNIEKVGDKLKAAHILFNLKDISSYLNDLKDKQKTRVYLTLPEVKTPEEVPTQ